MLDFLQQEIKIGSVIIFSTKRYGAAAVNIGVIKNIVPYQTRHRGIQYSYRIKRFKLTPIFSHNNNMYEGFHVNSKNIVTKHSYNMTVISLAALTMMEIPQVIKDAIVKEVKEILEAGV